MKSIRSGATMELVSPTGTPNTSTSCNGLTSAGSGVNVNCPAVFERMGTVNSSRSVGPSGVSPSIEPTSSIRPAVAVLPEGAFP